MLSDPDHIAAMATDLILNQARSVPRVEIDALVREQFNGLGHADRAILADLVAEAIAIATLTVDIGAREPVQDWSQCRTAWNEASR